MRDENTIICRCSDVSLADVRKLIAQGYTSLDEIKRITRIGMGPCQGKTCGLLVLREISLATGKSMSELKNHTIRPVAVGVKLGLIAKSHTESETTKSHTESETTKSHTESETTKSHENDETKEESYEK